MQIRIKLSNGVNKMKAITIENRDIINAITSGDSYNEIDSRKLMLFKVEQIQDPGTYEVTDPEEMKLLLDSGRR